MAYLMPDVNDASSADLEAGLMIDGKQMRRSREDATDQGFVEA